MLKNFINTIGPGQYLVGVWDSDKEDIVRGIVTKSTRQAFYAQVKKAFDHNVNLDYLFNISVATLADQIPGVHTMATHPVTMKKMDIYSIIIDLNDNHGWSREQIADWLDTLDDQPKFNGKVEL